MKVTVIIPNYNGKHFMGPCLESLSKQTYQDFKILVVDNASSDGSVEYMKENYPQIKCIVLDQNYGFSKAVNVGILQADTPYVFLLNNDTTIEPDCIQELVKEIERSPYIFSVNSKMLQMHHPELIDTAGDLYTILGWGVSRGKDQSSNGYIERADIFSACAGAALYRRNIFKKIGYFDENHFAYLEDIDVGYRAKIFGYKNIYCPTAIVYHAGSGTSGSKYNSFKVKLSARNSVYLNYKNMPLAQLILNALPLALGYLIKAIFFIKIGFGKDYLDGVKEGFQTYRAQKKIPFKMSRLKNYISIEMELLTNTFRYISSYISKKL